MYHFDVTEAPCKVSVVVMELGGLSTSALWYTMFWLERLIFIYTDPQEENIHYKMKFVVSLFFFSVAVHGVFQPPLG